jgi:hypothetical protein
MPAEREPVCTGTTIAVNQTLLTSALRKLAEPKVAE